jgi:hypothetical protein
MRSPAKTPQFWVICFFILANASWLQAQSFDTLVLKNIEKRYLIVKVLSIQADYVKYFRYDFLNGPEFRMNKQNVRWIITSSNEIIEVSESFNPAYRFTDTTSNTQPTLNQNIKAPASNPESTKEYYTKSRPRPVISEPQLQSSKITLIQENRYKARPKNNFFTFTFLIGVSTQRFQNYPGYKNFPGVSAGLELGYIGIKEKIYISPSIRVVYKNIRFDYSVIDTSANLNLKQLQTFTYIDFSLAIGYVFSGKNGNRNVFFIGPYFGSFIKGNYRVKFEGIRVGYGYVEGEYGGDLLPGEWDPNVPSLTQYRRPFEVGILTGLRFQASPRLTVGPDIKYGLTDIYPQLRNVSGVAGSLPQIRSLAIYYSVCLMF